MEYPFKDLLPLDEVLEREGYYKDWTHLDPEVFYSLTQISEYIKTKGYGVDVRLLIAQLAEHFGLKTTQVVDLANLLQREFMNLEAVTQSFTNNINSLVAQMEAEKNAVIANVTVDSEVILSRGNFATLGERLNDTATQLDQTTSEVKNRGIDVTAFGAVADNFVGNETPTDNSDAINATISYAVNNGYKTVIIPAGRYYLGASIRMNHNGLTVRGAGKRNTTLIFQEGVDAFTFAKERVGVELCDLQITTTLPDEPQIESNWSPAAGLKFSDEQGAAGATEVMVKNLNISNFYKGLQFRDFVWQSRFEEIRFNSCGYSIYQEDANSHTSMQNVFDHIYSNHPFFGGLRASNLQAEFIAPNFGSLKETAYMMEILNNSNIIFNVGNWEEAYVNQSRESAITIRDGANVSFINPSFKDLMTEDNTLLSWISAHNDATVFMPNHRIYQPTAILLGTLHDRARVKGTIDNYKSPLWRLVSDTNQNYRQRLNLSDTKSVVSNRIAMTETPDDRIREYLFQPSNRGLILEVKAIYILPHSSGYGELEVYQIISGSKIKLANMQIKNSGTVGKNSEETLNIQIGKFESGSPVYVGGYGLGTLQVVCNYEE